jgi:uncharacterized protein YecT (DUF1311 family)
MPTDRTGDPWPGATYKGFAGGAAGRPEPAASAPEPQRRRLPTRTLMIGGVIAALVLGVLFGLLARPQLVGSKPTMSPATTAAPPAPAVAPGAAQVPIAVNPPPAPEPLPRAPGRLETLPPDMAAASRPPPPTSRSAVRQQAVAPTLPAIAPPQAAQAPVAPTPPTPQAAPAPFEPAPTYRASYDCATARPGAEQAVCSDPGLAAADRRMARAYRRAIQSGIAPEDLRQEQRDWMMIREDAARHSRQALGQVYEQRIRELNDISDNSPDNDE